MSQIWKFCRYSLSVAKVRQFRAFRTLPHFFIHSENRAIFELFGINWSCGFPGNLRLRASIHISIWFIFLVSFLWSIYRDNSQKALYRSFSTLNLFQVGCNVLDRPWSALNSSRPQQQLLPRTCNYTQESWKVCSCLFFVHKIIRNYILVGTKDMYFAILARQLCVWFMIVQHQPANHLQSP